MTKGDIMNVFRNGLNVSTLVALVGYHVVALTAAWYFYTHEALLVAVVLYFVCGCLGVCIGFHRLLTHGSFETFPVIRYALAVCGSLAGQDRPITWVAMHRKHHQCSDREGDPHSPRDGFLWAHMLWFLPEMQKGEFHEMLRRYAKDLLKDRGMRFICNMYVLWHVLLAALLFLAGFLWSGWFAGISFVVWGIFVRTIAVLHFTWMVNSVTHLWGYRNYQTTDNSRNNPLVAAVSFGEGWHNNHHGEPTAANHGQRWWEVDVSYWVICSLECCRLAWNVKRAYPPTRG